MDCASVRYRTLATKRLYRDIHMAGQRAISSEEIGTLEALPMLSKALASSSVRVTKLDVAEFAFTTMGVGLPGIERPLLPFCGPCAPTEATLAHPRCAGAGFMRRSESHFRSDCSFSSVLAST